MQPLNLTMLGKFMHYTVIPSKFLSNWVPVIGMSMYLQSGNNVQYTKRGFTIFHVGFGVATLCLAQSRWFHGDGHREFQVNQRDSQRDEERGVVIDFRDMGCFIATPCLFVSGREIPCLYVSEREIYDLLFTFAISAHGSKVQLTAYAQKPS